MKKQFGEGQMGLILADGQRGDRAVDQFSVQDGVSRASYYGWKRKYRSVIESGMKRLGHTQAVLEKEAIAIRETDREPQPLVGSPRCSGWVPQSLSAA